jgi:hypothetical protein
LKTEDIPDQNCRNSQSPIRRSSCHWRMSPLKPSFSATRNVEMTQRSICLPDFLRFRMPVGIPPRLVEMRSKSVALRRRRFEQGQRSFEGHFRFLYPLDQRRLVHIVICHDIRIENAHSKSEKFIRFPRKPLSDSFGQLDCVKSDRDCEGARDHLTCYSTCY